MSLWSSGTGRNRSDAGSPINKFGSQIDIDTVDVDQVVWPVKSSVQAYIFQDADIPMFLKSSSGLDTLAGTGAQKVEVAYRAAGSEITAVIEMTGAVNSPLPENCSGSFRMEVSQTGSGNVNAGNIDLVDGSGNIYTRIATGEGQTQISVYRVPAGKRAVVKRAKAEFGRAAASTQSASVRLRVKLNDGTLLTKIDGNISNIIPILEEKYEDSALEVNAGEWIFWEVLVVSANDTPISAIFDLKLQGA